LNISLLSPYFSSMLLSVSFIVFTAFFAPNLLAAQDDDRILTSMPDVQISRP